VKRRCRYSETASEQEMEQQRKSIERLLNTSTYLADATVVCSVDLEETWDYAGGKHPWAKLNLRNRTQIPASIRG